MLPPKLKLKSKLILKLKSKFKFKSIIKLKIKQLDMFVISHMPDFKTQVSLESSFLIYTKKL